MTTRSQPLAEWLLARIADDEATARAAVNFGPSWWQGDSARHPGRIEDSAEVVVYDEGRPTCEQGSHIARHDPARVLAECAAQRAIVERCVRIRDDHYSDDFTADALAEFVLGQLASVHADQPGYRQEWSA
jgi:hypothetical protein